MNIDLSKSPMALLLEQLLSVNPNIPQSITESDIAIRRLTDLSSLAYQSTIPLEVGQRLDSHPDVVPMCIPDLIGVNGRFWIVRKWIYCNGSPVTINFRADDLSEVFIDGVKIIDGGGWRSQEVHTFTPTEGNHEILIHVREYSGNTYAVIHITDGVNSYESDNSWMGLLGEGGRDDFALESFLDTTLHTSLEIDLKGQGSESFGDYVVFNYGRVPVESVFTNLDVDSETEVVELAYPLAESSMFTDSINNFEDIYNSWYRFSHKVGLGYPANADELDGWIYNSELDVIESTENSGTYIGFISDDKAEDYEFSTVMTSNNNDNDAMIVVLAATKQGDVDAFEHTLSLITIRGADNGPACTLRYDYNQDSADVIYIYPVDKLAEGESVAWSKYYVHVYAKRVGDVIDTYVKFDVLPTDETLTRDEIIQGQVDDCANIAQEDLETAGYTHYAVDLAIKAPLLVGEQRYGYGQLSQANTRFWNIRRPNDNPEVSDALKQYFLDTYNWNVGDTGIAVSNQGSDTYVMSFDNVVYKGDLTLVPEESE